MRFNARYEGECSRCSDKIENGDVIEGTHHWRPGVRVLFHPDHKYGYQHVECEKPPEKKEGSHE